MKKYIPFLFTPLFIVSCAGEDPTVEEEEVNYQEIGDQKIVAFESASGAGYGQFISDLKAANDSSVNFGHVPYLTDSIAEPSQKLDLCLDLLDSNFNCYLEIPQEFNQEGLEGMRRMAKETFNFTLMRFVNNTSTEIPFSPGMKLTLDDKPKKGDKFESDYDINQLDKDVRKISRIIDSKYICIVNQLYYSEPKLESMFFTMGEYIAGVQIYDRSSGQLIDHFMVNSASSESVDFQYRGGTNGKKNKEEKAIQDDFRDNFSKALYEALKARHGLTGNLGYHIHNN